MEAKESRWQRLNQRLTEKEETLQALYYEKHHYKDSLESFEGELRHYESWRQELFSQLFAVGGAKEQTALRQKFSDFEEDLAQHRRLCQKLLENHEKDFKKQQTSLQSEISNLDAQRRKLWG